jgi:NADPH2:quinone reductase
LQPIHPARAARVRRERRQLGAWFREGKLRPHVSQTLPLHQAAEALRLMAARQVKGKLVLTSG